MLWVNRHPGIVEEVGSAVTSVTEQTVEHYDQVCDINIRGVLLSMKHEIPAMLRSGGGAIVNNSSIGGHIGFNGSSVYVASKFAVIGLTKTAALEFAKQGVRLNSVSPGTVQTEMFDRRSARERPT